MIETRKQLLEILSNHMDKTLSEGCLFMFEEKMYDDFSIDNIFRLDWFKYDSHDEDYNCKPDYIIEILWSSEFFSPNYNEIHRHTIDNEYNSIEESIKEWLWWAKILGHYDITAVLKYIEERVDWIDFISENKDVATIYYIDWFWERFLDEVINIPNKPLHLYTQQEDKELLKLLKKL